MHNLSCIRIAKTRTTRRSLDFGDMSSSPEQMSCFLCKQQHTNSPSQWKKYVLSINAPQDAIICKACRQDISRFLADSSITPRWLKSSLCKSHKNCAIHKCSNVAFSTLQKTTTPERLSEVLQSLNLDLGDSGVTLPIPLCKSHYYMIYKLINPTQRHCITCNVAIT